MTNEQNQEHILVSRLSREDIDYLKVTCDEVETLLTAANKVQPLIGKFMRSSARMVEARERLLELINPQLKLSDKEYTIKMYAVMAAVKGAHDTFTAMRLKNFSGRLNDAEFDCLLNLKDCIGILARALYGQEEAYD